MCQMNGDHLKRNHIGESSKEYLLKGSIATSVGKIAIQRLSAIKITCVVQWIVFYQATCTVLSTLLTGARGVICFSGN